VSTAPPGGIALARHGETAYNAEGRFQGLGPVPLNDRGREQASALGALAAQQGFVALYASPLERAHETARIVGAAIGLEPRLDTRFRETDTGDWTDRAFAAVHAEEPDDFARWGKAGDGWRFPGGESFAEQTERMLEGVEDVRRTAELPALIVCHGAAIRTVLCHVRPDGLDGFWDIDVPNGSLVWL